MTNQRPIHSDFLHLLGFKEQLIIEQFTELRAIILEIYPESTELLYHTHALTAVFSMSPKLSDAFCMIPIYSKHLNLGFNKGTLLSDPQKLLQGTGKWIRHIPISNADTYRSEAVRELIRVAIDFAKADMDKLPKTTGQTISKIKN